MVNFYDLIIILCFCLLQGWWNDLLNQGNHHIEYSGKMVLLLDILTACTEIGDKALVFSQSIPTLDVIEYYLSKLPRQGKKGKRWKRGKDWYRCASILRKLAFLVVQC